MTQESAEEVSTPDKTTGKRLGSDAEGKVKGFDEVHELGQKNFGVTPDTSENNPVRESEEVKTQVGDEKEKVCKVP